MTMFSIHAEYMSADTPKTFIPNIIRTWLP